MKNLNTLYEKLVKEKQEELRVWKIYWYDITKPSKKYSVEVHSPSLYKAKRLAYKKILSKIKAPQLLMAVDMDNNKRYEHIVESINIPIKIGDTLLGGKFKNKKIIVKDIGKNERGEPTINGKNLMNYRLLQKENISLRLELLTESFGDNLVVKYNTDEEPNYRAVITPFNKNNNVDRKVVDWVIKNINKFAKNIQVK